MNLTESLKMYNEAKLYIPSGVNSNSRYRNPHPIYYKNGKGAYLTDLDNNKYLDIVLGNGAIILGHDNDKFMDKFYNYLNSGIVTGVETDLGIKVAKKFLELVPTADQVRFSNTGTEAILHAIMMSRTYTGKQDVAVIEGAYNGWSDVVNVSTWSNLSLAGEENSPNSLPGTNGLNKEIVESTLVLPFNNIEATKKLIEENHTRIAALVIEPTLIDIGYIEGDLEYIGFLREICTKFNIVLIFDELLTGFRESKGGFQNRYNIQPDLSTFGKAIGNGFPLSAVSGKREIMKISEPGPNGYAFVGTYNGHQVSLAASLAFFEVYEEDNVLEKLDNRTESLINHFNKTAKDLEIDAQMVGKGGHIHWYFSKEKPKNYRQAATSNVKYYDQFTNSLLENNVYCLKNPLSHHAISLAHESEELTLLKKHMDSALNLLKE